MSISALPTPVRWVLYLLLLTGGTLLSVAALAGIVLLLAYPQLPSVEVLTDYQPKIPLPIMEANSLSTGDSYHAPIR